jgi:signal transduction histidine kinase
MLHLGDKFSRAADSFGMRLVERFGRQPEHRVLAEGFGVMLVLVAVDLATPWRFSLFGFYSVTVFIVTMHVAPRSGIFFALAAAVLAMLGEVDAIPFRGLDGYLWACLTRIFGVSFATGFGIYSRKFREEMRRRVQALQLAKDLEQDLVRAGEREQMRLGQDLHDGVCQTLAALDCAAECLRLDLEADRSPQVKIATELKRALSEATLEVRNLARGIYPVWKEGETLPMALSNLVARLNTLCRGTIEFRNDGREFFLDSETAMHLYRITQEALQNAMRHANATRIIVEVETSGDQMTVSVVDDGCGSGTGKRPDGIGWRTMKYRARLIDAHISILSPEKGGTLVRCSLFLRPSRS